jgi:hypothetical protein
LKAEIGLKAKKEKEEETSDNYGQGVKNLHHEGEEIGITTSPEEFLKWRLILAEQVKKNGYGDNADSSMNLAQTMLEGRRLEAFLTDKRSQEAKNRVRKSKKRLLNIPPSKSMILLYSNSQIERLTSKVDGAMPKRGRDSK